jgi:hypothetical protein
MVSPLKRFFRSCRRLTTMHRLPKQATEPTATITPTMIPAEDLVLGDGDVASGSGRTFEDSELSVELSAFKAAVGDTEGLKESSVMLVGLVLGVGVGRTVDELVYLSDEDCILRTVGATVGSFVSGTEGLHVGLLVVGRLVGGAVHK